jgi:hypothetical protein
MRDTPPDWFAMVLLCAWCAVICAVLLLMS